MRAGLTALGLIMVVTSASAQDHRLAQLGLPRHVEQRVASLMADPATRRYFDGGSVPADITVRANVVSTDGMFTLAGRIEGELVVIGGSLELGQGSQVTGDVTVIGGEAYGLDRAAIGGTFTSYGEGFELYQQLDPVVVYNSPRRRHGYRGERSWGFSNLTLRTSSNYNRVEGLPVVLGPVIQTGGRSPTRVEALGIVRTAASNLFDADQMGYQFRAEQFLGTRALRVGATLRSVIEPIESWYLSDLEASLATFILGEDQRDYFGREGWGAYLRLTPVSRSFSADVGYWDERFESRATRNPWTLFRDGPWRAQPLIAEGRLQGLSGRIQYDGRNDDDVPTSGVYVRVQATHGLRGSLLLPERLTLFADSLLDDRLPAESVNPNFTTGLIDLRLYRRVNRNGTLALRGVAGGAVTDRALPAQFQHALGGSGTLPGYGLFTGDCGARSSPIRRASDNTTFYARYGCDRFALGSIEYRGSFGFDFGGHLDFWGRDPDGRHRHVGGRPTWMLFFDAGQGWALPDSRAQGAQDTGVLYDAGAGIMLGSIGVFSALPLTGEDRAARFFVRLGARF